MAKKVHLKHQKIAGSGSCSLSLVGSGGTLQIQIENEEDFSLKPIIKLL